MVGGGKQDAESEWPNSSAGHALTDKLRFSATGAFVEVIRADRRVSRSPVGSWRVPWFVLLLLCVSAAAAGSSRDQPRASLKIEVFGDRMTVAMTGYPQVYLHGEIDADAPQRFRSMMTSSRIPAGSDIYLNIPGGDLGAGMALGRIFRKQGMATHLGTPRRSKHASVAAKTAVCVDACVFAYLGGLYRWAPSGKDRIGFSAVPVTDANTASRVKNYLAETDIDAATLAAAITPPHVGMAWMTADRMLFLGLANNGKLPLIATVQLDKPTPTIELQQVVRRSTHRLSIECRPGRTTVTALDEVGALRARQVAARGARAYFQLGDTQILGSAIDGATVEGNALVIRRSYPPADLGRLVSAWSVGAWVDGRSKAFRDGFSMPTYLVRRQLGNYFQACWRAAPWTPQPTTPG
jgi:hypothetical protein